MNWTCYLPNFRHSQVVNLLSPGRSNPCTDFYPAALHTLDIDVDPISFSAAFSVVSPWDLILSVSCVTIGPWQRRFAPPQQCLCCLLRCRGRRRGSLLPGSSRVNVNVMRNNTTIFIASSSTFSDSITRITIRARQWYACVVKESMYHNRVLNALAILIDVVPSKRHVWFINRIDVHGLCDSVGLKRIQWKYW